MKKKVLTIQKLLEEKREEILSLAAQHGARNVRIFGSVARNEAKADSDVDFLVEMESGRSLLDRVALIQDLEDLLGRKVDVANVKGLREFWRERILQESITF
jgi:predicted nucleotidyltransferase